METTLGVANNISRLIWQMPGSRNIYECHFPKVKTELFQRHCRVTWPVHDRGGRPATASKLQRLLVFLPLTSLHGSAYSTITINMCVPPTAATLTYVTN